MCVILLVLDFEKRTVWFPGLSHTSSVRKGVEVRAGVKIRVGACGCVGVRVDEGGRKIDDRVARE